MMQLTEGQEAALEVLRASEQPMTTASVFEGSGGLVCKSRSNTRRVLVGLVKRGLVARVGTGEWAAVENGAASPEKGSIFVTDGEAKQIIGAALAFYFESLLKTDPEGAARVAYTAGLHKVGMPRRTQKKADEPKPEPKRKALPKKLTLQKFCGKAEAAYRAGRFSLDELSDATGLGRDYLRKIIQGKAHPRDETLEKIYAAVEEHLS